MGEQVRHVHILAGVPGQGDDGRGARLMVRLLRRDPSLAEADRSHAMSAELAAAAQMPPHGADGLDGSDQSLR
jgi:hypothetical protein